MERIEAIRKVIDGDALMPVSRQDMRALLAIAEAALAYQEKWDASGDSYRPPNRDLLDACRRFRED